MIKNRVNNIVAITTLIFIIILFILSFPRGKQYIYINTLNSNIGNIENVSEIRQTFYANEDNLYGIGIIFGKYMDEYYSDIEIIISDKQDNVVATKLINGRNINEGKFTHIYFDEIKESYGQEYNIIINCMERNSDQKVTIYSSNFNDYIYGDLYIDGEKQNFDISFMTEYKKSMNESINRVANLLNLSSIWLIIILVILFISLFNLIKFIFNCGGEIE